MKKSSKMPIKSYEDANKEMTYFSVRPSKKFGYVLYRSELEQECPYTTYPCGAWCPLFVCDLNGDDGINFIVTQKCAAQEIRTIAKYETIQSDADKKEKIYENVYEKNEEEKE